MSQRQAAALLGPPQQRLVQELEGTIIETWIYLDRTLMFHNGVLQLWQAQLHASSPAQPQ